MTASADLRGLLLQPDDLPADYVVTSELHTEEPEEFAENTSGQVLDAASIEYTSGDGQRVIQATVLLNDSIATALDRISEIVPIEPDTSDPHVVRMDTNTELPDFGRGAIATTHVIEKGDEQAIIHMIGFSAGVITAIFVLWDLSEELELADSIVLAEAFLRRVRSAGG